MTLLISEGNILVYFAKRYNLEIQRKMWSALNIFASFISSLTSCSQQKIYMFIRILQETHTHYNSTRHRKIEQTK